MEIQVVWVFGQKRSRVSDFFEAVGALMFHAQRCLAPATVKR